MRHPHLAVLRWTLLAEDWSGNVAIRSSLDGSVINGRGPALSPSSIPSTWRPWRRGRTGEDGMYLVVQTNQSRVRLALAARTRLFRQEEHEEAAPRTVEEAEAITQEFVVPVRKRQVVTLEKTVALYSSRDRAISECGQAARSAVTAAGPVRGVAGISCKRLAFAVAPLRRRTPVVPGRGAYPAPARLPPCCRPPPRTRWTSTPRWPPGDSTAKPTAGHIFWDELYFLFFYIARIPEIARSLLLYRYRRLDAARRAAREEGYAGGHVSLAERQRRRRRDPEAAPEPQLRTLAGRQQPPGSGTSTSPSPTTYGATTRPPGIGNSYPATAPR